MTDAHTRKGSILFIRSCCRARMGALSSASERRFGKVSPSGRLGELPVIQPASRPSRGMSPSRKALADDLAWVRSGNIFQKMMPHSYLHQYLMRVFYRLWKSSQLAACFRRRAPWLADHPSCWSTTWCETTWSRRRPALYAAAMLGLVPFHALYSRSGWGPEIPMALFHARLLLRVAVVLRPD
jgi:hypothetical protein